MPWGFWPNAGMHITIEEKSSGHLIWQSNVEGINSSCISSKGMQGTVPAVHV